MLVLTHLNFDSEVLQSVLPVLVLWSALDIASNQIDLKMRKLDPTKVKVARVDIDSSPDLVMRFTVRDVPLVVLYDSGLAIAQDTTLTDALISPFVVKVTT